VGELINLAVDLDERFADDAPARELIARAGYELSVGSADERTLAWIDEEFGGAWSSEVAVSRAAVAHRAGAPCAFSAFGAKGLRFRWLREMGSENGVGLFGPFGVEPRARGSAVGPALLHVALCGLRAGGYRRALIPATNARLAPYYERHTGARIVERHDPATFVHQPVRTVVLASGSGTNFQSVIDRVARGLPLELNALVSNNPEAFACERARAANVPAIALPWRRDVQSREAYDDELLRTVQALAPELVLLLGWMHLLASSFVESFASMLNIHPAFLPLDPHSDRVTMPDGTVIPAFRGARAVREALSAKSSWIGATMHEVTMQTDRGRVLVRKPLRITNAETEEEVLGRLHPLEHDVVGRAILRWIYEREA
jgi:phosphoribosylglycinamide formyltransferase 1